MVAFSAHAVSECGSADLCLRSVKGLLCHAPHTLWILSGVMSRRIIRCTCVVETEAGALKYIRTSTTKVLIMHALKPALCMISRFNQMRIQCRGGTSFATLVQTENFSSSRFGIMKKDVK